MYALEALGIIAKSTFQKVCTNFLSHCLGTYLFLTLLTLDMSLFLNFVKFLIEKRYLPLITDDIEHYMFISRM